MRARTTLIATIALAPLGMPVALALDMGLAPGALAGGGEVGTVNLRSRVIKAQHPLSVGQGPLEQRDRLPYPACSP